MICPRCGCTVDEPGDFCSYCGVPLKRPSSDVGDLPDERADEFQTEVLRAGDVYAETVVDTDDPFDPRLFSGRQPAIEDSPASAPTPATTEQVREPAAAPRTALAAQPRPSRAPVAAAPLRSASAAPRPQQAVAWQQPAYGASPDQARDAGQKTDRLLLAAIVALAVVVVVALAVGVIALLDAGDDGQAADGAPGSTDAAATAVSGEGASAGDEGSASAAGAATSGDNAKGAEAVPRDSGRIAAGGSKGLSDSEAYRLLLQFHDDAADFDERIASCATEFNATCFDDSKQARTAKASKAAALKREVRLSWDAIADLDMPFWSKNLDAWQALVTCYECLWHRIDAIDRAWNISLSYDKPKKHESEILAPIKADNGSDGKNKYYVTFASLYPSITLVNPANA